MSIESSEYGYVGPIWFEHKSNNIVIHPANSVIQILDEMCKVKKVITLKQDIYRSNCNKVGSRLFIHGGIEVPGRMLTIDLDKDNCIKTTIDNSYTAIDHTSIVYDNRFIIYHGGYDSVRSIAATRSYDTTTDTWCKLADSPICRSNHTAILRGVNMIIQGGVFISSVTQQCDPVNKSLTYNISADTWIYL